MLSILTHARACVISNERNVIVDVKVGAKLLPPMSILTAAFAFYKAYVKLLLMASSLVVSCY